MIIILIKILVIIILVIIVPKYKMIVEFKTKFNKFLPYLIKKKSNCILSFIKIKNCGFMVVFRNSQLSVINYCLTALLKIKN